MIEKHLSISAHVLEGIHKNQPVVALESTVITHGLSYPLNLETARAMESAVNSQGAIPATIGVLKGKFIVGLTDIEIQELAKPHESTKVSPRNVAGVILRKDDGGTTVAGTMLMANKAGIKIFATGGIGGIHRGNSIDISADLPMLAKTPMIVVCSGAKAILDLPATREYLETHGIPVIGYKNDEMAAFYSSKSGLKVDFRAETAKEISDFARIHWEMSNLTAVLVTVPPPMELEMDSAYTEKIIQSALKECNKNKISGSEVTPFLLSKMAQLTEGESVRTNTALLINNAVIAANIACEFFLTN